MIFVTFNFVPDHWQGFYQGVVRGLGVQEQVVKSILSIHWFINLPLCYCLAFPVGLGLKGLWIGQSTSLCLIGFLLNLKVLSADWIACADDAKRRSEKAKTIKS